MITADQIMAGKLPTSKRTFKVAGVGEITLHRLPAADEIEAKALMQQENVDEAKLEKVAQKNIYYMLYGKFDAKACLKLSKLMDTNQLASIYTTGLFFMNLEQENLEAIEKN